jgi:uncharacterized membrane protein YcjF (UPF0283 family)
MNIWMDIAIPALVTVVALAVLAGWALREKKRLADALEDYAACTIARNSFKTQLEACQGENAMLYTRIEELRAARTDLKTQLEERTAQRDTHRLQADTSLAQLDTMATGLITCMEERNALKLQLDEALRPKTTPVVEVTPKQKRSNSRAKQTEKEQEL